MRSRRPVEFGEANPATRRLSPHQLAGRLVTTLAFAALVVALSIAPGDSLYGDSVFIWAVEHTPSPLQNAMHLVCYATLTLLLVWCLEPLRPRAARLALAIVVALALGIGLEWYQLMVPGRFGSIVDIALNALGTALGIGAALLLL